MLRSIGVISLLILATPALADGPSYNYIQGSYQHVNIDDGFFDVDGDGFGISGSVALGDNWQLIGGYNSIDFDFGVWQALTYRGFRLFRDRDATKLENLQLTHACQLEQLTLVFKFNRIRVEDPQFVQGFDLG